MIGCQNRRHLNFPHGEREEMIFLKGTYEAPTSGSTRRSMRELGMAYSARAVGSRSLDSTRRSHARPGKPGELVTGGSQAGVSDTQRKGGTRDAKR
jgi:hypothetical protein